MDIVDNVVLSLQSIVRNKRRSTAMIAGIILGVSILSGIIIYTEVLQQQNFESIIGDAEYEVTFKTIENTQDESDLWNIAKQMDNDVRIDSYTVFTGPSSSIFSSDSAFFSMTVSSELDIVTDDEPLTTFSPLFVRDNFTETTIYNKLTKDFRGEFDLKGVEENKTVIPEIIANRFNLQIGSVIEHINITVVESSGAEEHGRGELLTANRGYLTLRNVKVVGIYSSTTSNSGLFSNFASAKFYFNTELIDLYGNEVQPLIKDNKNYYLAVKINADEFTVTDLEILNKEINILINDYSELSIGDNGDDTIVGNNEISTLLQPFEIINIFLIIFDIIIVLPLIILCLYLLGFGLELALEERKREIAIFKVQGANASQIFAMIRNETLVLFVLGASVGYAASIVGAWIIGTSIGFMTFDTFSVDSFKNFITLNITALAISFSTILFILVISVYKKGKEFIRLEVTEAVQRSSENKMGLFRRNNIDVFMVVYGLIAAVILMIDTKTTYFETIDFNPNTFGMTMLIDFLGTIFLWIGAALSGARVAKYIPQKSEKTFLSLPKLRRVGLIIRSGLKKRGDIDRLVLIIVLTLSITTLAGIQGVTDHNQSVRNLDYEIGADFKVSYSAIGNYSSDIMIVDGVSQVMELPVVSASVLSSSTSIYGMDPNQISNLLWDDDGFDKVSLDDALTDFKNDGDIPKILIGNELADELRVDIGEELNVKVIIENPDANVSDVARMNVKIIGIFDHAPGNIDGYSIVSTFGTVNKLNSLIANETLVYSGQIPSKTYLIQVDEDADTDAIELAFTSLTGYSEIRNLEREYNEIGSENNYGIPGLLTMMYLTSLIAAIISAFAFSAIIMERRKREFAVLQTVGASSGQIYMVAFGENFLIMLTSVFWGLLSGVGLSFLMNGFFTFIGELLRGDNLPRNLIINWETLLVNGAIILGGMLFATLLSVRSSVNQDLTEATRTI